MTAAIVGLGLIGGSFAKAIKEKTEHRVLGFDLSHNVIQNALSCGAIDDAIQNGDFSGADITLVALYPADAVDFLKEHAAGFKRGALVIDLCGVKRFVCGSANKLFSGTDITFIGGHPMAGRECFGFENAVSTLFDGASMILTPDENVSGELLAFVGGFFRSLGFSRVEITTPERHDEMIAYTSQLAHIVSSAYVKSPLARGHMGFSAGSFKDLTRVAKLNENMWSELFLDNGDYLSGQIQIIIDNLTDYKNALDNGDISALCDMLRDGREIKERLEESEETPL